MKIMYKKMTHGDKTVSMINQQLGSIFVMQVANYLTISN